MMHSCLFRRIPSPGGMNVRLIVFGAGARMEGAAAAARRAGWETLQVRIAEEEGEIGEYADAVLLPWPVSFRDGKLAGTDMKTEEALSMIPRCRLLMHGAGLEAKTPQAQRRLNPERDEGFLTANALLTAEGAIARAMQRPGRALAGTAVLVAGFGRIAQALTIRLCALGAFVIVCARSEMQMRAAHASGAHPVPLAQIAQAAAAADLILGTVPATVLHAQVLQGVRRDTLILELASPPYGADMEAATRLGLNISIERGIPGRYAPLEAGAALFEAAQRYLKRQQEGV